MKKIKIDLNDTVFHLINVNVNVNFILEERNLKYYLFNLNI